MITIFNRCEVCITRSADELFRVKDLLCGANIESRTYTNNSLDPGRNHPMLPGMYVKHAYEYRLYVKRSDYDAAVNLLRRGR